MLRYVLSGMLFLTWLIAADVVLAQDIDPNRSAYTPREEFLIFINADAPNVIPIDTISPDPVEVSKTSSEPIKPTNSAPKVDTPQAPQSDDFSYYVTMDEYIKRRDTRPHEQMHLFYKVEKSYAKTGIALDPVTVQIKIGPDYIQANTPSTSTLYDFKTRRILSIKTAEKTPYLDNRSLYAAAFSRINSVNVQTRKGRKSNLDIGDGNTLNAFWLEADQGWAARNLDEALTVKATRENLTAHFNTTAVLNLSLEGPDFIDPEYRRNLLAYWHFDMPIHPEILSGFTQLPQVPDRIETLTKTPQRPEGLKAVWTLTDSNTVTDNFPLSVENAATLARAWPVGFVLSEAVANRALGGAPTNDELRETIYNMTTNKQWVEAWIHAHYLSERLGGCANDPALLCEDIQSLEAKAEPNSLLLALIEAKRATGRMARLNSFKTLKDHHDQNPPSAFMSRLSGTLRSRLKSNDVSDIPQAKSAAAYLEASVIKNPYDPKAWRLLAQIYAAQGQFDKAWHIQDGLRHLPHVPAKTFAPIKRVEEALPRQASGFFGK